MTTHPTPGRRHKQFALFGADVELDENDPGLTPDRTALIYLFPGVAPQADPDGDSLPEPTTESGWVEESWDDLEDLLGGYPENARQHVLGGLYANAEGELRTTYQMLSAVPPA